YKRSKEIIFFYLLIILSIIFAFPTVIAKLPFEFHIPFISTAQPTRLIFVIDFCLAVLAAFGFDAFIKEKNKKIVVGLIILGVLYTVLWIFLINKNMQGGINPSDILVAKRNTILPTAYFLVSIILIGAFMFIKRHREVIQRIIPAVLLLITIVDLLWFANKFLPFSPQKYLFPS